MWENGTAGPPAAQAADRPVWGRGEGPGGGGVALRQGDLAAASAVLNRATQITTSKIAGGEPKSPTNTHLIWHFPSYCTGCFGTEYII